MARHAIAGSRIVTGGVVTFTPYLHYPSETEILCTTTTGLRGVANQRLAANFSFGFTTEAYVGTSYYVSPTGSGSDYTELSPGDAKTALTLATPGDAVVFLDGDYEDTASTWEVAYNPTYSGISGMPITLRSANLGGATFVRHSTILPALGIYNRDYIVVDGFSSEGMCMYFRLSM